MRRPLLLGTVVAGLAAAPGCGSGDHASRARSVVVVPPVAVERAAQLQVQTLFRDPRWSFTAVKAGDLDADGRPDLVAYDPDRGYVVRLATERLHRVAVPGVQRRDAAIDFSLADVDGDDRLDAVTLFNVRGAHALVSFGDGRGGFARTTQSPLVGVPFAGRLGAVTDITGDGRPDIVRGLNHAGPRGTPGAGIPVSPGRGDGTFGPAIRPTRVRSADGALLVADLDRDGHLDFVTAREVVRGLGRGRFAASGPVLGARLQNPSVLDGELLARWNRSADTRLAVLTDDGHALRRVVGTEIPFLVDEPLIGVRGVGAVVGHPSAIAVNVPRPGGRFGEPVVTPVPDAEIRALHAADLDDDGDSDVIAAGDNGRILLLRNVGLAPVARLTIAPTASIVEGVLAVELACGPGAGSCGDRVSVGRHRAYFSLDAGRRGTVRVRLPRAPRPRTSVVVRQDDVQRPAVRRVRIQAPSRSDRLRACRPGPQERTLAITPVLAVIDRPSTGPPVVCLRASGRLRRITQRAAGYAAAASGRLVAITDDVCPGGFEDCYLDVVVKRYPEATTLGRVHLDRGVARLAIGRDGALAIVRCAPVGESAECDDPLAGLDIVRIDGRGAQILASSPGIAARSLRASADGRSFSWRQNGTRRSAAWSGAPPRESRPPHG